MARHGKPQEFTTLRPPCPTSGKAQLSHAEAVESARRIRRRNRNRGVSHPLTEYLCDCGWWHVGFHTAERLVKAKRHGRRRSRLPVPAGWQPPTVDGYERLGLPPPQEC